MKKLIAVFSVLAIVGSALAFKTVLNPDLVFCNDSNVCEVPPISYATTGTPTTPPTQQLFRGNYADAGKPCDQFCPTTYNDQVFIND